MSHVAESEVVDNTPNVVISDPRVRKVTNVALGIAGTLVSVATIVDVAVPAIDIAYITIPAIQIIGGIGALFALAVTVPNVPKSGA